MKALIPVFICLSSFWQIQVSALENLQQPHVGAVYAAHIKREGGKLVPDDNTSTGYRWSDYKVVNVEKNNRVPATMGHGLHLIAVFYGLPQGARVTMKVVRPVNGDSDQNVDSTYERSRGLEYSKLRNAHFFEYVYFFDEDYDLIPGTWDIQVYYEGRLLVRKDYEVYAAAPCETKLC